MKAVVEVKGKQYIVEVGARIRVDLMDSAKGDLVEVPVLLTMDGQKNKAGSDQVAKAKVITHGLSKKIRVFKHHAKKRYRRTMGHRQSFTELEIETIGVSK